ncbi:neutrophil gelatinase-associated lipocalin-like [Octodon degus]|uniref:Neutrophil gelatinase-associated lipocalin-like n=1 Tax=Octodon degus TaxID=10160 RepID=A0A6P3VD22_OCTDE|nr:neutrophil gelatinase-associated lipocalin-like [Octodon degus]
MALALLWLGFTLLWALQTHAKYSPLYQNLSQSLGPSLSISSLQPNFKADKFQGKWYAIGVAESNFQNGTESQLDMYSTEFELKNNYSYIVTSLMLKEDICEIWVKELSPCGHPGEFTLLNKHGRTKKLSPKLKEKFVKFSKSVGLTIDNIIFTDPIGVVAVDRQSDIFFRGSI